MKLKGERKKKDLVLRNIMQSVSSKITYHSKGIKMTSRRKEVRGEEQREAMVTKKDENGKVRRSQVGELE